MRTTRNKTLVFFVFLLLVTITLLLVTTTGLSVDLLPIRGRGIDLEQVATEHFLFVVMILSHR